METKDLYTPHEVAKDLKINYRTVLREIQRGNLVAKRIGRIYLITRDSLESYLSKSDSARPLKVSAAIVEKGDKILLVRRKRREGTLFWQFPTGIVRYSEKTSTRAELECLQETGVHCKAIMLFGHRIHPDTKTIIYYWLCEYLDGKEYNADDSENAKVLWVDKEKVEETFTSDMYEPVRKYLGS